MALELNVVSVEQTRQWFANSATLSECVKSIGKKRIDPEYLENALGMPFHISQLVANMADEGDEIRADAFDSIPFYSLCSGLFIPLSGMQPEKAAYLFGVATKPPPNASEREYLLGRFISKDIGLSLEHKLASILGDPFMGKKSTFRRNSLVTLLLSTQLTTRVALLDRLTQVGDVAVLFAEQEKELRKEPALTALEVFETLRLLPKLKRRKKFELLRSLLKRCGKVEAYFVAKLVMRKAGFGFDYQGKLIARVLAESYGAAEDQVAHAIALTSPFHVAGVLSSEGKMGLKKIQLQPLVPVRPALAGGATEDIEKFPVWIERKYDGIRMMLHKSTGLRGSMLAGGYTRNLRDWLELTPGLDQTIKMIPAQTVIVDGELHGSVLDPDGLRPASVYEVYAALQGEKSVPVNLKYAAFDMIYLNGQDLTQLPLQERRKLLMTLLAPIAPMPLPVPLSVAEGQMAETKEDVNRLYHHFRSQGYEGIIAKELDGHYRLSERDSGWMKRKPVITLDVVLLGAVLAVTTKEKAGMFGSYVIGAKTPEGTYEAVGDVAGIDRVRDAEIQSVIMREGLLTGERIERQSASGTRPGFSLLPHIVVTVKFEGIVREVATGKFSLRDPKLVTIRSDKTVAEADLSSSLEQLYLRQRVG